MGRLVGIAMVRWDLGVVGYVGAPPQDIEAAYTGVFLRCYPTTLDMTRETSGKVSCILNTLMRRLPVRALAIVLDPYGVANEVGTKHGVRRDIVIGWIYSWFTEYLSNSGLVGGEDEVEVNEELTALSRFLRARVGGHASSLAGVISTIVRARGVDINRLPIKVVDVREEVRRYVEGLVSRG